MVKKIEKEKYIGDHKDGKYDGNGILTAKTDEATRLGSYRGVYTYVGEFKEGKRHGWGVLTTERMKHIGEFKEGKRNGYGTTIFNNGHKKTGDFKDGRPHGLIRESLPSGLLLEIFYIKGKRDGAGWVMHPDGKGSEMEYDAGVLKKTLYTYDDGGTHGRVYDSPTLYRSKDIKADGTETIECFKDNILIDKNEYDREIIENDKRINKELDDYELELFSDPHFIIEILEEFLDYAPIPNSPLNLVQDEISNAKEYLPKLDTKNPDNILLKNKVETHIRQLNGLINEKGIKDRPYPSKYYSMDRGTQMNYLNSRKDYRCSYCSLAYMHLRNSESKKWTCPSVGCRNSQWLNSDEMELLKTTYKTPTHRE